MHKIYAALLLTGIVQSMFAIEVFGESAKVLQINLLLDTNKIIQHKPDSLISSTVLGNFNLPVDSLILKIRERLKSLQKGKINYYLAADNITGFQNFTANRADVANTLKIEGSLRLLGMPIGIEYANNYLNTDKNNFKDNLFRINFDTEKFLENSTSKLSQIQAIKAGKEIRSLIAAELGAVAKVDQFQEQTALYNNLIAYISNPENSLDLLGLNETGIREQLKKIAQKQSGFLADTKFQKGELDNLLSSGGLDSVVNRIIEINAALKKVGLNTEKLRQLEAYFSDGYDAALPETLDMSVFSRGGISHLEPILSRIQTLKIGSFGNTIRSPMINQDILMRGAHLSVSTGRGPVTIGYGKNKDLNLVKDAGLDNSVYTVPQKLAYFSMGINNASFLKGKFTWINSVSSGELNERFKVSSLPKKTVGLSVNQNLNLKEIGILNFDLSKSASIYKTALEPGTERVLEHTNLLNDYLFDSSFQTLAMGVSHSGEIIPWNISNNFYVNYSGLGYQNPVGTGISPVRFKIGGILKKKFFNNKMALNLRADLRHTPIASMPGDRWKNMQVQFDSRFRLTRRFNISLKYMESGMSKEVDNISNILYSSQKFQLDANASFRVLKYFSGCYLNVAYQNLSNILSQADPGNFLNISYSQSMVVGQNSLTGNLFYNKELSPYQIIGDMVNGELCYQYVFDMLNMSTAVTYLENANVTQQYGARQSFQLVNGKNFDFSASADIRRNLIEPLYPDLYPACRAELSMKYYLKK